MTDRALSVYRVSFDFALLTPTVIITLRNSIRERIYLKSIQLKQ